MQQAIQRELGVNEQLAILQQGFRTIGSVIYVYNIVTNEIVYASNPPGIELGYTPEQIEAMGDQSMLAVIHPDDLSVIYEGLQRLATIADGDVVSSQYRSRRADGSWVWTESYTSPFRRDADGNILEIVAVTRDIHQQREIETELRGNERQYHQILDAIQDFVLVKGPKSRVIWANKAFRTYYGMSEEEVRGMVDAPFVEPDITKQYVLDDMKVFESGEVLDIPEEPVQRQDGVIRMFNTLKSPIFGGDGEVVMTVGVSRDITDNKLAQEEREALQQQLLDAQKQALLELSTPIIPIFDQIIVMPLIGSIDTLRAQEITRALLRGITQHRAQIVIVDITGVPVVDSGVADHLNRTIQAARLKGAHTIITGVSDAVAETIVDLGIDWTKIETLRDLQSGLTSAFNKLRLRLERAPRAS